MHLFPSKGHILFHVVQFAAMPVSPPFEISGYGPVLNVVKSIIESILNWVYY